MRYRIRYLLLLLAIPLQLAAVDYTVSITTSTCDNVQTYTIPEGEQILLKAHAKLGYAFSQWSDGNTDNPRVATINADVTFVAQFKESDEPSPNGSYTIVVKADGCTTDLACDIAEGTAVKLYAHPKECNYFFRWSDGNTDNPRTITVNSDAIYTAIFKAEQYTIEALPDNPTQGSTIVE